VLRQRDDDANVWDYMDLVALRTESYRVSTDVSRMLERLKEATCMDLRALCSEKIKEMYTGEHH
jgi:hypothetical protein